MYDIQAILSYNLFIFRAIKTLDLHDLWYCDLVLKKEKSKQ